MAACWLKQTPLALCALKTATSRSKVGRCPGAIERCWGIACIFLDDQVIPQVCGEWRRASSQWWQGERQAATAAAAPSKTQKAYGRKSLLRRRPKTMKSVLAAQTVHTARKWRPEGAKYFPLTHGGNFKPPARGEAHPQMAVTASSFASSGATMPSECKLKELLDNYPDKEVTAAPESDEESEDRLGIINGTSAEDLVEAVSNLFMQIPVEAFGDNGQGVSQLARKLADGHNANLNRDFSQKFLQMSKIQVEVQRRMREAQLFIEDMENMDGSKEEVPKRLQRRKSSMLNNNMIKMISSQPSVKFQKAPSDDKSQSEAVANQMRTIRRMMNSLNWPNLQHEFSKWVKNFIGVEQSMREFFRVCDAEMDNGKDEQADDDRDNVCLELTEHELRLTEGLRNYQTQMRATLEEFSTLATSESMNKTNRRLDLALQRKANEKQAQIRRISIRRQLTMGAGGASPRLSRSASRRSSRTSQPSRSASRVTSRAPSTEASDDSNGAASSNAQQVEDQSPRFSNASVNTDDDLKGEFDIDTFDDARFGHLKRIFLNHKAKIQDLTGEMKTTDRSLEKVIMELKEQVKRLIELQGLFESKTKNQLRRGSLFIPRRRALVLNQEEAEANNSDVLANRIVVLQSEREELMKQIKELGKALGPANPRRGAIAPEAAEIMSAVTKGPSSRKTSLEEPAAIPEEPIDKKPSKGENALEARIKKLTKELEQIKEQLTLSASQVNAKGAPFNLGKAVAFEMQPKVKLLVHYTSCRPEIDVLVNKANELLDLPRMSQAPWRKPLMDTLELATDTFDSEAAERKRCLQENQPFKEEQKWDEEVKQCMAVLHENVREAHADILEDLQHKRALAEQNQMQAGGGGTPQALIAAEAAARIAPSSPAAAASKASATKPATAATPRAEEVPKKPSGRRPSSRVPSPAPQVEPKPAESAEDAPATAAAVDPEAPVASEERLSVQPEIEIDELAPAEDIASDAGGQATVDVHSLAEETVEKTQETERLKDAAMAFRIAACWLLLLACTRIARVAALVDEDWAIALNHDDCTSASCAIELMQFHGHRASAAPGSSGDASCEQYVKCDASNKYQGHPCEKGYYCERLGAPARPRCLHWVNCARSCYCAQRAKLLEESNAVIPEVLFQDEDIELDTETGKMDGLK
eukprot:s743_g6.t3